MSEDYLWVEKYSPKTIDDCVLAPQLKKEFRQMETIPNLLFIGDAGVGKTTVAKVLCEVHGVDWMFMNASSERGIDEVRTKIDQFASSTSLFGGYKVIVLDEADNLTPDAQKALRHLIEKHQNNCRFVLTCNYPYDIIDPLRSRLAEYVFTFPESDKLVNDFVKRLIQIISAEKVKVKQEDVPSVVTLTQLLFPNCRKIIHSMQRACKSGRFDSGVVDAMKSQHISTLFDILKAKNFKKMREWVAANMVGGMGDTKMVHDIYTEMKDFVKPESLPPAVLILGRYQTYSPVVSSREINMVAMCTELMMEVSFK